MEEVHRKTSHRVFEEKEPPDTTTGDANPRSQISSRNRAKDIYYPKGVAFLKKSLCECVYPTVKPWTRDQLASQHQVFPEGQLVVVDSDQKKVVGFALSLVIKWDDYSPMDSWRDFTDKGYFTNHNPEEGRTLYGAEIMVDPKLQGCGIGRALYQARRDLAVRLGLLRIRAGARLRGYYKHASEMSAENYLARVVSGDIFDATISFQLRNGFQVLTLVPSYLLNDPESLGYAALIEWLNPRVASVEDYENQKNQSVLFRTKGGS